MQTGRRAGPPPPAPRGDGPAPKESLRRARARARPQGTVLARRPSVLARAGSRNSGRGPRSGRRGLVFPDAGIAGSTEIRRGTGGAHVEDRGGGFSLSSCGWSFGHGQQIGQLVTEFAGGTDQGGTVGGVQTGGAGFGVDNFQLAPGAQDHPPRQSETTSRQHTLASLRPPSEALWACVGSHGFKFRHGSLCGAK
jgi:hypothetical protein